MSDLTELVHIIDENGKFIPLENFNELVQKWGLLDKGFDYYTVAILGAQSSGKSTLLNALFNTTFQTLNADEGRTQTTKGIWMGHTETTSDKKETVLVFDVEGVDGRERGEKEQAFERKTSLFSLALADILIMNMWHTDVGRYAAGNIALMKTVFEQHLLLFGKNKHKKTKLLFIIRDHLPQETPLSKLEAIITRDMNGIWEGLTKPDQFANSSVTDFFEFLFVGLPHKIYKPEEFTTAVQSLKLKFVDPKNNEFIFNNSIPEDIPADGFAPYASKIWETIRSNKDLDLPSQKEMLAMYRCDEIMGNVMKQFNQSIIPIKSSLEKGIVDDFGKKISDIYNTALSQYDGPSSRYHQETAQKKRALLAGTMTSELFAMYTKQIQKIEEKTLSFFDKLLNEAMPTDGTSCKEFATSIKSIVSSTFQYFEDKAQASLLEGSDWSFQVEFEDIKIVINKRVATERENQMKKLLEEIKGYISNQLSRPLDKLLDNPSTEMWSSIRSLYDTTKEKAAENLREKLKGFEIEGEDADKKVEDMQAVAFEALKDRFKNKAKFIEYILSKKFEELFNLDDKGLPRRWKQGEDVKETFLLSRNKALEVLEAYSFLRLNPEHDEIKYLDDGGNLDDKLVVLSYEEFKQVRDKFEKETNSSYLQALRDQENVSSAAHVPMYIILLILVLGFNEFVHILTSPILLFLTIIIGAGTYVLYMLNMMGPAKRVVETLLHSSLSTMQHYVTEQMNRTHENAPSRTAVPPPIDSSKKQD